MKQFKRILSFEFNYYLKNKVFIGFTLVLVLAIAVLMFFPRLSAAFDSPEGEVPGAADEGAPLMLVLSAEEDAQELATAFGAAFTGYQVKAFEGDLEGLKLAVIQGDAECAFYLESPTQCTYYVENLAISDSNTMVANEILKQLCQMNALADNGLDPVTAAQILAMQPQCAVETLGVDQGMNFFYTYIMIFALYLVIMLYGSLIATNVATEKSSRAMELLITSARPNAMIFGKVLAACLAGLVQLVIIFGTAYLSFNLNRSYWADDFIVSSIFDMPPALLGYMLLFFLLGFLVYGFLYGATGSLANKVEDVNTSSMPLIFFSMISLFVTMFSMTDGTVDSTLMRICSYIPFTAPTAMFTRIAMSTVPWYEIALSVAILIGSVIGIGVLSAKIYRVGVLLYGTTPKISSVLKALRKA